MAALARWKFTSTAVALVAVFFAYSPPSGFQEAHFSDEPFEWPASLQYHDVTGAEGLVHRVIISGPPVEESKGVMIFMHGFPETAASWKHYLLYYADQGYHVLAPDLRNVNNTVASSTVMSLDLIADDLMLLIKSTGQSKAIVVAHDWGCGSAWAAAAKYPGNIDAMVIMAVPHLELYRIHNTVRMPFALRAVWYFLFYGLSGPVARWKAASGDFEWFIWWGFGSSNPNTFSKAEVARYKEMWARTITSTETSTMTSWYFMGNMWLLKSLLPASLLAPGLMTSIWSDGQAPSTVPTLQLMGSRDIYVSPGMFGHSTSDMYVSHPYKRTVIYDASHWLNHEKKTEIMSEMDRFFAGMP